MMCSSTGLLKLLDKVKEEDWVDPIKRPKMQSAFTNPINSRPTNTFRDHRRYHDGSSPRDTLFQLLRRAYCVSSLPSGLLASNPRDRIYGMLGLAGDTDQLGIRPDYFQSCEAVYTDAARTLLQQGHTDVLLFSQFPKKHSGLPTWVPDWTITIQEPCGGCVVDASFSASGETPIHSVPIESSNGVGLIGLDGAQVDRISQVGTPWLPGILYHEHDWLRSPTYITEIQSFCDQSDRLAQPAQPIYKSPKQREEAVWRIPCGDMDRLGPIERTRARDTCADLLEGYKLLKPGFWSLSQVRDHRLNSYTTSMDDMFKRRPILSAQGYVGLAPSHAEVGDVIVIIYGAIVPFVLRESAEGRFEFVGEAYVHGIMDGEYVEKCPPTKTFILC